ncbi:hypothetical protein GOV11_04025 [Candidatus Woesearchaeota archaeon]|nr:hypothetical protein [Candidatus Woesearchaeota archaeon]
MVYKTAARKTFGIMSISAAAGLAVVTFLQGEITAPTGMAIDGPSAIVDPTNWVVFALGFFVALLILGGYVYAVHISE